MALEVVGAGVGRTGTHSLKMALEKLLAGRCHHMIEIIADPAQASAWTNAIEGWEPICERLGVAVPDEPFPLTNTTSETRELLGMPALS
jgi:hypothetical protein